MIIIKNIISLEERKKNIGKEFVIQYCSRLKNIDVNKTKRDGQVIYIYFEASNVRNTIG